MTDKLTFGLTFVSELVWTAYLSSWTAWNHVRTMASLAAAASFTMALCQQRQI